MALHCGNCHKELQRGDKYCRYCGTPKGLGAFLPFKNETYCVYAPPMTTRHKCKNCGYAWTVNTLGVDRAEFCPKCKGNLESETDNRLYEK